MNMQMEWFHEFLLLFQHMHIMGFRLRVQLSGILAFLLVCISTSQTNEHPAENGEYQLLQIIVLQKSFDNLGLLEAFF